MLIKSIEMRMQFYHLKDVVHSSSQTHLKPYLQNSINTYKSIQKITRIKKMEHFYKKKIIRGLSINVQEFLSARDQYQKKANQKEPTLLS